MWKIVHQVAQIVVGAVAAVMWLIALALDGKHVGLDALRGIETVRRGYLECKRGHRNAIFGVFQCASCGFRYEGSIFLCENKECGAGTAYIDCSEPSCKLSIPCPTRWGHP